MSKSKILLIMTGSIACYKACQLISKLVQSEYDVQVVATQAASEFIGNSTIEGLTGKSMITDLYAAGNVMDHIHLSRWADLILVAPATANYINKAMSGVGDDLASTLFLSHDFKKPFLIAPAMNTAMYLHPVTQASIKNLQLLGVSVLETASGVLACGEVGWGKLLDPELIFGEIEKALRLKNSLPETARRADGVKPLRVLVTGGGTVEKIDEVRAITNLSSGKTAKTISEVLFQLGCDVTLISSEKAALAWAHKQQFRVLSYGDFESLRLLLKSELQSSAYDFVIHAAAVSDYSLEGLEIPVASHKEILWQKLEQQTSQGPGKISSDFDRLKIVLKKNPKLVNHIKEWSSNKNVKLIAFKLTARSGPKEIEAAITKLAQGSGANFIIHNDTSEMNLDSHQFHLFDNDARRMAAVTGAVNLAHSLGEIILNQDRNLGGQ